jgi:hypothetical protein
VTLIFAAWSASVNGGQSRRALVSATTVAADVPMPSWNSSVEFSNDLSMSWVVGMDAETGVFRMRLPVST